MKYSGIPVPAVAVYSTFQDLVVDSALTSAFGGALLEVVDGGEITAAGSFGADTVAISVGDVRTNRDYTLIWPWDGPAAPYIPVQVALSESLPGLPRVGAGYACGSSFPTGQMSASFPFGEGCAAPNGSFLVYAEDVGGSLHGSTLVAAGSTAASIVLVSEPRSQIFHIGQLPAELVDAPNVLSEILPLHLSLPLSYPSLVQPILPTPGSFSFEHAVHLAGADELLSYLYLHKGDVTFMRAEQGPVLATVSYDDIGDDFCPFGSVESNLGQRFEVSWTNACADGSAVLAEVREGGRRWIGIFPVGTDLVFVPPIPGLLFAPNATVGASFMRLDPPLEHDDIRIWNDYLPPLDGVHSFSVTSRGANPGAL